MPALLEDPLSPPIPPPAIPISPDTNLPPTITPRRVTLRDRITIATLLPFSSPLQVPPSLLAYLSDQLNREIEKGDTYPMVNPLSVQAFGAYWFGAFGAVMVLGEVGDDAERHDGSAGDLGHALQHGGGGLVGSMGMGSRNGAGAWGLADQGVEWEKVCLGSFYVKPNYPGRSSHVCNGGFLVTDAARNKGVGRLMGEGYLEWAPKLGYTYSVFNLVYETNTASLRIWDALGFKRIGRVKCAGALRSYPDTLIDAVIYGRDLGPDGEDFVSEERFDKIRFYLKHGKYPNGADRAEKSRLRSAATHYKLLPPENGEGEGGERLMLKDKEVVADPQRQYEIARVVHAAAHGGINKTTATIAEKFHWVRIKETVSLVIKNCPECKEQGKVVVGAKGEGRKNERDDPNREIERLVRFDEAAGMVGGGLGNAKGGKRGGRRSPPDDSRAPAPVAAMNTASYGDMPLDPLIMQDVQHRVPAYQDGNLHTHQHHGNGNHSSMDQYDMEMDMTNGHDDIQQSHATNVEADHEDIQQQLLQAAFDARRSAA